MAAAFRFGFSVFTDESSLHEIGKKNADGQIENPPIPPEILDSYLSSYCISAPDIRADDFVSFMRERRNALLNLIGNATGHPVAEMADSPEEGEELSDQLARDNPNPAAAE